jgi:hypothetical protein
MSKLKKKKAEQLKGVCLHCLFIKAHGDKWPNWSPKGDDTGTEAFQDLVHSAIKIAVNVFVYLDDAGQMQFMQELMDKSKKLDDGRVVIGKIMEAIKARGPTQH